MRRNYRQFHDKQKRDNEIDKYFEKEFGTEEKRSKTGHLSIVSTAFFPSTIEKQLFSVVFSLPFS